MDATVIDLIAWRETRPARTEVKDGEFDRVERAMSALETHVRGGAALGARHETDLLAITGALSLGLYDEAAERIERLAVQFDHPSARGGR